MRTIVTILGLLNGLYMLLDGIYVMLKGKYIGPPQPGPWRYLFEAMGLNVFRLGPLFIIFGLAWLTWLYALWTQQSWAFTFGVAVSICTLWYLPAGTVFSLVILSVLFFARARLGI